jgi:N-acetylglucosaminyldiphosphoundecaprenol N-acetyl-beta-D-mannosaminyltransferase
MGVGGSFDFISGKITRAPKWARRIGLEWLWRLMMQPKRIGRIIKSVVIFPIRILINR